MTQARENLICLEETSFYHCYVRCVRRAFLCGEDMHSGTNYDHRKQWLVSRLKFLSYIYAIDICAYAVMSNHYHVVLHVDQARAQNWTQEEVVERWLQLYQGNLLIHRWVKNKDALTNAELKVIDEIIEGWRERLCCISWFMRGINETIARMANEEEKTKGRFWEGRFRSQALLDEAALLTCMTYVDLNPVRASMTDDLIDSDFTSIQHRLFEFAKHKCNKSNAEMQVIDRVHNQEKLKSELELDELPEAPLMPFDGSSHTDIHIALPFSQEDYFDLVDQTGRMIREDKRGAIDPSQIPIISRLGINPQHWLDHVKYFSRHYAHCVGTPVAIRNFVGRNQKRWGKGIGVSARVYRVA